MIKQLEIDGLKSYDDFGLYISSRKISQPKKKIIKETIPFSNVVYDFSNINGELYWEERTLEYSFDIAEFTTEEMEDVKSKVLNWLLNVHDTNIYDPYIGDYHFRGSFESDSWEEDFGGGTLSVVFSVYPYKIANEKTILKYSLKDGENNILVQNESSHRIIPTIDISKDMTIQIGTTSFSIAKGSNTSEKIKLESGENQIIVIVDNDIEPTISPTITFEYVKENF